MADPQWHPARLIPVTGIGGVPEQESRATSALLAVLQSVKEFRTAFLKRFGALTGSIETFIEVPFQVGETGVRPDGLIRLTRGSTTWVALIEVKTGSTNLDKQQIESYLDVCRQEKFQAVITISNELVPAGGGHPISDIGRAKLKSAELHHVSWSEIRSLARVQASHQGVADPDQAWILNELVRYLEHDRSGALDFSDMGASWTAIRDAVSDSTLRATDKGLSETVQRWDQLLRYTALRLERKLGPGVQVVLSRREQTEPGVRLTALTSELVANGTLSGTLRVPNTAGPIELSADLRRGRCFVRTSVDAPLEGRPTTRVNWVLRQLSPDLDSRLTVECWQHMARTSTSEPLSKVRANPLCLVPDANADIRRFVISAASPLGSQRGIGGRGSFIDSIIAAVEGFYEEVTQSLKPWAPKAPQVPSRPVDVDFVPSDAPEPALDDTPTAWSAPAPATVLVELAPPVVAWESQLRDLEQERAEAATP
jgi:hypothetical protein